LCGDLEQTMLFRLGTRANRERDEPIMSRLSRGSVVAKENLECQSGLGESVGEAFWPFVFVDGSGEMWNRNRSQGKRD